MRSIPRLTLLVLLVGCASEPAPQSSEIAAVPSRERHTADILQSIGVHDNGTLTRARVSLGDRLGEEPSIELVDGDHLVMTIDDSVVVLERAPKVYAWERIVYYVAEIPRTDLGQLGIELRRSDGSIARSTVVIPRAFAIERTPSPVRSGDTVEIGLAPAPAAETWGLAEIQCDGIDGPSAGALYDAGDGTPTQATIPAARVPEGAASCDANLTLGFHSREGTYDPALANADDHTPLGIQQRTTRVRYYP